MTPSDITRYRLASQQIALGQASDPGSVVARLGAMQAQDYAGAVWGVGLRLKGATEADIERAVAERRIVRTWPMRGTLHFVAAEDVRWMLELGTPRIVAGSLSRQRQLELDDTIFARARDLFIGALQGGKQLTRDDMYQVLEEAGITTDGQRGYHILWRTAQDGCICFGSHTGKQPTFVLLDEWVPEAKRRDREESLAELVTRYFTSHGPATVQDFCWWSGLSVTDAKTGLEAVKSHLAHETVEGKTYWMSPDLPSLPPLTEELPSVHILPGFDEYMLGYRDRSAALDPIHAKKIVPGSNGVFMPTIVVNGRVVGIWKRAVKKKAVTITPEPFAPLKEDESRAFQTTAQRYGEFLGLPVG
jgi:hypothetical protein